MKYTILKEFGGQKIKEVIELSELTAAPLIKKGILIEFKGRTKPLKASKDTLETK